MNAALKQILAQDDPEVDPDALMSAFMENLGFDSRRVMKTEQEIATFRKRSCAAKLGWRRRRPGADLSSFIAVRETIPVCFLGPFKRRAKS